MAVISKEGIVRRFADKMGEGLAKAHFCVDTFIEVVTDSLKEGHDVRIQGYGMFKIKRVGARMVKVPSTQEDALVPEHTTLSFKVSGKLRDQLKEVLPKP